MLSVYLTLEFNYFIGGIIRLTDRGLVCARAWYVTIGSHPLMVHSAFSGERLWKTCLSESSVGSTFCLVVIWVA
jgi:hypothetical protein